jgi:uncharacterized protein
MNNPLTILKDNQTFSVLGVNQDFDSYANKILRKLREKHKTAYPVNPKYSSLFNEIIYERLENTPTVPEVVVFVVNPTIGIQYLQNIKNLGIKTIWLQPGTISEELLAKAKALDIEIVDACVLVVSQYL